MIVAIAAVSSVAAALFADASQVARVATEGATFTAAQRLSTSAGVVKGNLGITIVLVSAEQAGVEVEDDVGAAITRVRSDLDTMNQRADDLDAAVGGRVHRALAADVTAATSQVLDRLALVSTAEEAADIDEVARADAVPLLTTLEETASTVALAAQRRIDAEQSRAGDAARMTSLTVALVIPAAAVWGLWSTARRREERLAMRAELDKKLSLIRSRDDLIAGLSHQLRTPLTAISGYAQALLDMPDDRELQTEGLVVIDGQATELARMVDDLVVMGRLEYGQVEYHLQAVDPVKEIEAVVSAGAAWGGRVQTSLSPTTVWADRLRLRHIVTNLVSNAVRHGGPTVIVKSATAGGVYRIVVADDGDGLDAAKMDAVFEPYVHTPRDALVTGTLGLGLAVAKRLAETMNCRLGYERMNGYTLFVLDVPLASGSQAPVLEQQVASEQR